MSKTYDEMKGQFSALRETAVYIRNRINVLNRFLEEKPYQTVAFLGCGSSFSVSKSLEAIYRNLSGKASMSLAAGDLMLHTENYKLALDNAVIVAVTRSGSTSEVLKALEAVKALVPVRVIALTCVEGAPIAELADVTFTMPWAFDESVCQTRTVSNLYLAGAIVAAGIARQNEAVAEAEATVEALEAYAQRIEPLFLRLAKEKWDNAVVLADGEIGGIAEEGALAFTEIAMLPGWCFHLLDYRHGPIVVSGGKTLTLVLLRPGEGELQGKMVQDVMARGSIVVTISDQAENLYGAAAHVQITGVDDFAAWGILFIYVAQMTALLKALALGGNPDQPKGLDAYISL